MTDKTRAPISINVIGPFRVTSATGVDLTPKGTKNQALVALLALSDDCSQPRRWLEDKLWSSFGPEQASANLRQALAKVRNALGDESEILTADRSRIGLDQTRVTVDLRDDVLVFDERLELLQGLDVRDQEFEEWLRMERMEFQSRIAQATPKQAKGVLIRCHTVSDEPGRATIMGDILADRIGENIAEQVRAWRQSNEGPAGATLPDCDIAIHTQMVRDGDAHAVFVRAVHQSSGRILYSKLETLNRLEDILECSDPVDRTVYEVADQIIGKLPQVLEPSAPEARATALSRLGLYRMFSLDRDALREARGLMEQAYDHDDNGVYLAWSSLIRTTQFLEMSESGREALKEEALELQYKALELGADNALVHAVSSKVRGNLLRDNGGSLELAQNAVERNPANAFAWVTLAEANMRIGNRDAAFDMSARARRIARSSPFKHWWDTGHCVIAIACGRPNEAIEAGESAARAAPLSRPAHRHLLALYALEGQLDKANAMAEKLRKIEPGFSLDQLVNDEAYPVRTLRNMNMLDPIRALL